MTLEIARRLIDGTWQWVAVEENGGGAGAGAARVLGPFPFAFDDAGLEDGVEFYTPTVGDILLDAWIEVTEAFDGTTPFADIGSFDGVTYGLFGAVYGAVDVSQADSEDSGAGLLQVLGTSVDPQNNPRSSLVALQGAWNPVSEFNVYARPVPGRFTAATPLKIVLSQDGEAGSAPVGGTAGIGAVYLVAATPSLT